MFAARKARFEPNLELLLSDRPQRETIAASMEFQQTAGKEAWGFEGLSIAIPTSLPFDVR